MVFEFIENKERLDLPWQDKAKAIYQIHEACCLQSSTRWHNSDTAKLLGLHPTVVGKYLQIGRTSQSTNPKLIHVIKESETLNSAVAAIDRVNTRSNPAPKLGLGKVYTPAPAPIEPTTDYEEDLEPVSLGAQSILHADFHKWAADYIGAPFNFIHCDFPYGISYNTGGNFSAPADTVQMGQYDDSAEVYWELLDTLRRHEEQLIADSCHIMFWFSQSYAKGETDYRKNMRRLTEDYFLDSFPAAKLQSFPMIWNHSQLQTTPDHNRYGARTYETAMLLTFGDRKIVKPVHLCCEYNTPSGAKIHRSQKPIPVLRHFFSMFVDDTTTMLDPTCGSGSSVITAHQLGAPKVLGIEQDEPTYKTAIKYFEEQT